MTSKDILEQVLQQFQVVYLERPQLDAITAQALRVLQNKVGPFTEITFADGSVDTPADFAAVAVAMDSKGRWQEVQRVKTAAIPANGDTPEIPATDKLCIVGYAAPVPPSQSIPVPLVINTTFDTFYNTGRVSSTKAIPPFTVHYFQNLTKVVDVPFQVEALLYSYLYVLIEIPNTQRARQVALATGRQEEFPSDEELKQRRDAIEADMEESQSIVPSAAVF